MFFTKKWKSEIAALRLEVDELRFRLSAMQSDIESIRVDVIDIVQDAESNIESNLSDNIANQIEEQISRLEFTIVACGR